MNVSSKLVLNQETLKNLTQNEAQKFVAGGTRTPCPEDLLKQLTLNN